MKAVLFTLALLASTYARALNSAIFGDGGEAAERFAGRDVGQNNIVQGADVLAATPTKRITNGERLRRHLPLLPPKRRTGTLTPRASCLPTTSTTYTGKIEVRYASSGSVAGKLANWNLGRINFLGPEQDLIVQLTKGPTNDPIEMIPTNDVGPSSEYPYFGAVGSASLNPGSDGSVAFGGVAHTPANSPPSSANAESTIWLVDPLTLELKAQWTNPDGSRFPTTVAYSIRENQAFLVGDADAWMNYHPNYFISAVTFHLVSFTTATLNSCTGETTFTY